MKKTMLSLLLILGIISAKATTIVVQNTNDNGIGSLRQAVKDAKTNDTIRFNPVLIKNGSDSIVLDSAIIFSMNLVFKGLYNSTDTLYISGKNKSALFIINLIHTNLNLVLDSMTLKNANSLDSGAGIFIKSNAVLNVQILNSKITQCNAIRAGGGININTSSLSDSSFLFLENSIISHNNSEEDGGGIYTTIPIHLKKTIVSYNTSSRDGGGIFSFSSIHISDSEITNNSGDFYGGGITCFAPKSFIKINNSLISNNTSNTFGGGMYVYNSSIDMDSTIFTKNIANTDGGGFFSHTYDTSLKIKITNTTISFNTALEGYGGAIGGTFPNLDLTNSKIINNNAYLDGGGISAVGKSCSIHIQTSSIKNNSASNGNGGGINSNSTDSFSNLNIENSTIASNYANKNGSGIYLKGIISLVNISNSTISNHTGEGFYVLADSLSLVNIKTSTIMYNRNGIISVAKYSNLYFAGSILAQNYNGNLIQSGKFKYIQSNGYNIFGDTKMIGSHSTDTLGVSISKINISNTLANNGGATETLIPLCGSLAIDGGNPADTTTAQNAAIFNGRRDIGAAEYLSYTKITTTVCEYMKSLSGKYIWNTSGTYFDTITDQAGCRSVITVFLTVNHATYSHIIVKECEEYKSPSGRFFWTKSGYYNDTLINGSGCDSVITINLVIDSLNLSLTTNSNKNSIISNQTGAIYQWIDCKDNSDIKGETNIEFTPKINGNYAIIITYYSCKDTSECISVTNAGINKFINDEINIFPNPNNGIFEIQFKDAKTNYTIVITDILGKSIKQFKNTETTEKIDLRNYENGIYLVNISNEFASQTIKIVKE